MNTLRIILVLVIVIHSERLPINANSAEAEAESCDAMQSEYRTNNMKIMLKKVFEAQIVFKGKIQSMDIANKKAIKVSVECFYKGLAHTSPIKIDRIGDTVCIDDTHVSSKLTGYESDKNTPYVFMVKRVADRFEILDAGIYELKEFSRAIDIMCDFITINAKARQCAVKKPCGDGGAKTTKDILTGYKQHIGDPIAPLFMESSGSGDSGKEEVQNDANTNTEVKAEIKANVEDPKKSAFSVSATLNHLTISLSVLTFAVFRHFQLQY